MTLQEKYTPKTLDDIKIDEKIIDSIISWANLWLNDLPDPSKPGLLLYGHPGIGKTLVSRCLARDCEWNLLELNASDVRTRQQLFNFNVSVEDIFGRRNCVLFDEIDGTKEEGFGEAQIRNAIMKAKYPVILTANDLMKVPKTIRDVCEVVQIYRPSVNALKEYLIDCVKKERMKVSPEVLQAAANTQDYRMGLAIIESGIILEKKKREPTLIEQTSALMLHSEIGIKELRSLLWYIEENAKKHYDILDLDELLNTLSDVDKYNKRGQEDFALRRLREIPKCVMIEEIKYPVMFQKEKEKKRKKVKDS